MLNFIADEITPPISFFLTRVELDENAERFLFSIRIWRAWFRSKSIFIDCFLFLFYSVFVKFFELLVQMLHFQPLLRCLPSASSPLHLPLNLKRSASISLSPLSVSCKVHRTSGDSKRDWGWSLSQAQAS